MSKNIKHEYSAFTVPSVKYGPSPAPEPEPKRGWVRDALNGLGGVERFGMTHEEIERWENRVNFAFCAAVVTSAFGLSVYVAVKVANFFMGVG